MAETVTLNIAAVKLTVESADAVMIEQITRYCQKFVVASKGDWTLRIYPRQKISSLASQSLRWDEEKFQARGRTLFIDGDAHSHCINAYPLRHLGWGDLLRAAFGILLVRLGGVLVHGAAFLEGDCSRVFFGPSGRGKTTLSRLAEKSGKKILTDESVAILPGRGGFWAWATPFYGELGKVSVNAGAPLEMAALLQKAKKHGLIPISPNELFKQMIQNLFFFPANRFSVETLFDNLERLTASVPGFILHSFPNDEKLWGVIDDGVRLQACAK